MRVEGCIVPDACSCDLNVCLSRAPSVGWSWIHTNERPRKKLKWLPIRHFERMNVFRLFLFFFFNSNLDHHCYTTWLYCLNQFNQANWEIISTPCVILGVIWDSVFDLACFHHPRLHHQFKNTKKKKNDNNNFFLVAAHSFPRSPRCKCTAAGCWSEAGKLWAGLRNYKPDQLVSDQCTREAPAWSQTFC